CSQVDSGRGPRRARLAATRGPITVVAARTACAVRQGRIMAFRIGRRTACATPVRRLGNGPTVNRKELRKAYARASPRTAPAATNGGGGNRCLQSCRRSRISPALRQKRR